MPLRRRDGERTQVCRVDDGLGLEGARVARDPDDDGAMVVDLQHVADRERHLRAAGHHGRLRELIVSADEVDDDAVGAAEIRELALHHLRRSADQRRVVEPDDVDALEIAVRRAGPSAVPCRAVPPTRRLRHRARASSFGVLQRLDVVDILHFRSAMTQMPGCRQVRDRRVGACSSAPRRSRTAG